ncbi:MAG: hypothetical protein OH333_04295 [Candidatus Parvarchaeota archaeon]|nr:hypothetical protein [Candidatus Jingweiarchaeum tengchongense]MCW1300071.1 hypothetical protein [Candidatus Jingweiarchaeum tengchongense]MCW1305592.1 hypothetical protein [Candidatus Jingweiarchaeum tengchongense]MCW1310973.1 hypothetical protein [Candidatus Jingweiarchaeum tengchongense]
MNKEFDAMLVVTIAIIVLGVFSVIAYRENLVSGIASLTGYATWNQTTSASVTVNEYISATLSNIPIDFGSLDPGTTNQPATNNPLLVQVGAETNVEYNITLNGTTNFVSGGNSFSVGNLSYNTTEITTPTPYELNVEKNAYTNEPCPCGTQADRNVWHYISVPAGQVAGAYSANIKITVKKST